MNSLIPFLRCIADDPSSDAPRLVFADYLEENGYCDWSEYIRTVIELAGYVEELPIVTVRDRSMVRGPRANNIRTYFTARLRAGVSGISGFGWTNELGEIRKDDRVEVMIKGKKYRSFIVNNVQFSSRHNFDIVEFRSEGQIHLVTSRVMPRNKWRAKTKRVAKLACVVESSIYEAIGMNGVPMATPIRFQRGFPTAARSMGDEADLDLLCETLPIESVEVGPHRFAIVKDGDKWDVQVARTTIMSYREGDNYNKIVADSRSAIGPAIRELVERMAQWNPSTNAYRGELNLTNGAITISGSSEELSHAD